MNEMSAVNALEILDKAASLAPLNRADHVAVQQALKVLLAMVSAPITENEKSDDHSEGN